MPSIPNKPFFSPDEPFLPEPDSQEIYQPELLAADNTGPVTVSLDYLLTKGFEPSYPLYAQARQEARQRLASLLRRTLPLGSQQRDIVRLIVQQPEEFLKAGGAVHQSRVAQTLRLHPTTVRYHLEQLQRYV
jgi:hypothetical protein